MSSLMAQKYNLLNLVKSLDPTGHVASIVELLSWQNSILQDMPFIKANDKMSNLTQARAGLPQTFLRGLNQGTQASKSHTTNLRDVLSIIESWSIIDATILDDILDKKDKAQARLNESMSFLESMAQTIATQFFYGNHAADQKQFNGLGVRYSTLNTANAQNALNVIEGGGTGSVNTSVWFLDVSPQTIFMAYPQGSETAGIKREDKGKVTSENFDGIPGNQLDVYKEKFSFIGGLVVRDWRHGVRIANLDVTALRTGSGVANVVEKFVRAYSRLRKSNMGTKVIYAHQSVCEALMVQLVSKKLDNGLFRMSDNEDFMRFMGMPIKPNDGLLTTETRVV